MSADWQTRKVLVVDDDKKICDLFTAFIKIGAKKISCVTANDVTQALFKIDNQEFDLVFIDQKLPSKSGTDFIRTVRTSMKHRNLKIILMSAALEKEDILTAMEMGVSQVMVKPFTFAQIMEKLKDNLHSEEDDIKMKKELN